MNEIFTFFGIISHNHAYILITHTLLAAGLAFLVAKMATASLQIVPKGAQNVMEAFLEGVITMGKDVIGEEKARKYLPLIATLGLFIFISNMMGIIPGFESPTSNINFTLALALCVFIYYNYEGIKDHGVAKYFGSFIHLGDMNPIAKFVMTIFMFPIEILSHLSRIVSLSFRLFGNIKGDDLFLMVILMLVPFLVPIAPFFLLLFFGVLQSFIFMILTYVYLAGAVLIDEGH